MAINPYETYQIHTRIPRTPTIRKRFYERYFIFITISIMFWFFLNPQGIVQNGYKEVNTDTLIPTQSFHQYPTNTPHTLHIV